MEVTLVLFSSSMLHFFLEASSFSSMVADVT
jgi:hypothetical protein